MSSIPLLIWSNRGGDVHVHRSPSYSPRAVEESSEPPPPPPPPSPPAYYPLFAPDMSDDEEDEDVPDPEVKPFGMDPIASFRPEHRFGVEEAFATPHPYIMSFGVISRPSPLEYGFVTGGSHGTLKGWRIRLDEESSAGSVLPAFESRVIVQHTAYSGRVHDIEKDYGLVVQIASSADEDQAPSLTAPLPTLTYVLSNHFLRVFSFDEALELSSSDGTISNIHPLETFQSSLQHPNDITNTQQLTSVCSLSSRRFPHGGPSVVGLTSREQLSILDFSRDHCGNPAVLWKADRTGLHTSYSHVAPVGFGDSGVCGCLVAAAGFCGWTTGSGAMVDCWDLRMDSVQAPAIKIVVPHESSFNGVIGLSKGIKLVTTSMKGRVQVWDVRSSADMKLMLRENMGLPFYTASTRSVYDWRIIEPISDQYDVPRALIEEPPHYHSNGHQPRATLVVSRNRDVSHLGTIKPLGIHRFFNSVGEEEVIIPTRKAFFRWTGIESRTSMMETPLIEYLPLLPRHLMGASVFGPVGERDFGSAPLGEDGETVESRANVLLDLLESLSDFRIKMPHDSIRTFRSLLLDSSFRTTILSKKRFVRLPLALLKITEEDLMFFLLGVSISVPKESLTQYFLLFSQLRMIERTKLICVAVEGLINDSPLFIEALMVEFMGFFEQIPTDPETAKPWHESPFIHACVFALCHQSVPLQVDSLSNTDVINMMLEKGYFASRDVQLAHGSSQSLRVFRRAKSLSSLDAYQHSLSKIPDDGSTGNLILVAEGDSEEEGEGEDETNQFRVHVEILVFKNPFFRTMMMFGGANSSLRKNSLYPLQSETFLDSREIMSHFAHFMYQASLPEGLSLTALLKLLCFGDFSTDPVFTTEVMNCISSLSTSLAEENRLKLAILDNGYLLLKLGQEWLLHDVLTIWSIALDGNDEEVLAMVQQSAKFVAM